MTPLPGPLGDGRLVAWRLDQATYATTWDSGEGAYRVGGRWNSRGMRAVYCSLEPAAAILELAVHKGFAALDTVPQVLSSMEILSTDGIYVVEPSVVPNANWLRPGIPGKGQQDFGDGLLARHRFLLVPSTVSTHSWNLVFEASVASGFYRLAHQEPFALDTRPHPPCLP